MENFVTKKKKLNMPVFIILLIFAIVPGIIYFIWSKIPTKISTNPDKEHGWLARVIGSAVAVLCWTFYIIVFHEGWMTFITPLLLAVGLLVLSIFTKKNNSRLKMILNLVLSIVCLCYSAYLFFYGFVSIVGCIVTIVGCTKGLNHYGYHILGNRDGIVEEEE